MSANEKPFFGGSEYVIVAVASESGRHHCVPLLVPGNTRFLSALRLSGSTRRMTTKLSALLWACFVIWGDAKKGFCFTHEKLLMMSSRALSEGIRRIRRYNVVILEKEVVCKIKTELGMEMIR